MQRLLYKIYQLEQVQVMHFRYMLIQTTESCLRQIDEANGLDLYLLRTADIDINSRLGCKLKREVLVALADKSYWPDNQQKRDLIAEKYAEFVVPLEEASWVGLDLNDACRKQQMQEEEECRRRRPLKYDLEQQFVDKLRLEKEAEAL